MRPPVQRERGAVDEAPQVVVLVEVSDAVLHLVRVKVGLHVRDLDEGLQTSREGKFKKVDVLNGSFFHPLLRRCDEALPCSGPACTCLLGWSP